MTRSRSHVRTTILMFITALVVLVVVITEGIASTEASVRRPSSASTVKALTTPTPGPTPMPGPTPYELTIGGTGALEPNPGMVNDVDITVIFLQREPFIQPVQVSYRISGGTATQGSDYIATEGTLTFDRPEQQQSASIPVRVLGDFELEPLETVYIQLYNPSDPRIVIQRDTGYVEIIDNPDPIPYWWLRGDEETPTVEEGDFGTTDLVREVLLEPTPRPGESVGFRCWTVDSFGTAVAGEDYVSLNEHYTITGPAKSVPVIVRIKGDVVPEDTEALLIYCQIDGRAEVEYASQGLILDSDVRPQVSVADASIVESTGVDLTAAIEVTAAAPVKDDLVLHVTTRDVTASAGSDFEKQNGTVTILAGDDRAVIPITVFGDREVEGEEVFEVEIGTEVSWVDVVRARARIAIADDDPVSDPQLSIADGECLEGDVSDDGAIELTISLDTAATGPVSVTWSTAAGTATDGTDFFGATGTVTLAAGETAQSISIPIRGDAVQEPDEFLTVQLSNALGAEIGRATATAVIINDDTPHYVYRDVIYEADKSVPLHLDLYVPKANLRPGVALWLNDDGWTGTRELGAARRLLDLGIAVAVAEYTNTFPAALDDLSAALRWLRDNGARFGVDARPAVLWGAGTGGHLAALLGTRSGSRSGLDFEIAGAIVWYAPTDLVQLTTPYTRCYDEDLVAATTRLLGCDAQSCVTVGADANPAEHVSADDPPFLIMHGGLDCRVPSEHASLLDEALRESGVSSTLVLVPTVAREAGAWHEANIVDSVDHFVERALPRGEFGRRRPARR